MVQTAGEPRLLKKGTNCRGTQATEKWYKLQENPGIMKNGTNCRGTQATEKWYKLQENPGY